ncbi:MAG TPA: rhodanese-like domain-containing protein [Acholeplasmataceae bacterium]|nr:rhodanese-like domain-containing protein [Acholeplasmataceae bacterium]
MKKLVMILLLLFLSGCAKNPVKVYTDPEISEFEKVFMEAGSKAKKYDLRHLEDCRKGRIPGFYCARVLKGNGEEKTLEDISEDLALIVKNKRTPIILIDYDGGDAEELSGMLREKGFVNIHFFRSGYGRYAELKGDDFVPDTGECESCEAES